MWHPALWWLHGWLSNQKELFLQERRRSLQAAPLTLESARSLVQEAPCSPLNASLEGELVHLVCPLNYAEPLGQQDPLLSGIPQEELYGFRLDTYMQVFQWDEFPYTRTKGSKKERDFLYFREWMTRTPPRNTSFFGKGRECKVKNGGRPCYQWRPAEVESWWNSSGYELGWSVAEVAQNATAGEYLLPEEALLKMPVTNPETIQPACTNSTDESDDLPCAPGNTPRLLDSTVVWQQMDSNETMIDYLTRLYELSTVDTISILAVQRDNSFVPWPENADNPLLFEFIPGSLSASQIIDAASSSVVATKWLIPWLVLVPLLVQLL